MEPGITYWEFIEPICESISIYDGPDIFHDQFFSVAPAQRNLFAAHWCNTEILNGGLLQFFYNSTGILAPEAVIAFREIGLTDCAEVIEKAMAFFGESYPRDTEERREKLGVDADNWPAESPFDELDDKYYDLLPWDDNQFEKAADNYAEKHRG